MLLVAPLANLGRCPRRPPRRKYWWTLAGRCRQPDAPGCCSRLIPVGPVGRWGTLPPSDSDPAGPDGLSVTDGPVGQLGTLSPSTFASAILVDPGGTLPSSDLAGMLLPAIPVSPVGIWGTLSSSDSDPADQNGPHVAGGPVGPLGTLSPTTPESGILVDPGGMFSSSNLARMRVRLLRRGRQF